MALKATIPAGTIGRATKALKAAQGAMSFLDSRHPIYVANHARWVLNEARYAGGDDVLDELEPFDWETDLSVDGHLQKRKNQAIYINFPEIFCSALAGHLLRFAPKPGNNLDFGGLGKVGKTKATNSRADMIYQNPDGPGATGSGWDLWWSDTSKLAAVTGHRWIYVESPDEAPMTQAREAQGMRPYLAEYSPIDVTNWSYDGKGNLMFAVLRFWEYYPERVVTFAFDQATLQGFSYLLLVREGYVGMGPEYAGGGWFKFTPEKEPYDSGDFADTMGEIPLFPLFYERSKGTRKRPGMSRPGVTELGQAAIAGMNVGSAANFNAIDIGQGLTFFMGVDQDGQELAVGQIKRGDRWIGVPPNEDTEITPHLAMSGQASVTSSLFDARERAIWAAAVQLGISEAAGPSAAPSAKGGPGQSGAGQQASHATSQAPKITKVAANLEQAQQIAIDFLHLRFGLGKSTGSVTWPKKFDLVELVDRIKQYFEVSRLSGVASPTVDSTAMTQVAKDKGLIGADPATEQKVLAEFQTAAQTKQLATKNAAKGKPVVGAAGSKMAPPQKGSTADKQKAREAGKKQDKKQAGRNTGGLR